MLNTPSAFPFGGSQSNGVMALPRLADVRRADKSTLISRVVLRGLVRLADFCVAAGSGLAIAFAYVDGFSFVADPLYLPAILLTSVIAVGIFELLGLYSSSALPSLLAHIPRLVLGWMGTVALLESAIFFLKIGPELSRGWLALWLVFGLGALFAERIAVASLVRHWARTGQLYRRAVIFGAGSLTEDLIRQLEADQTSDLRITGVFDDRSADRVGQSIVGYPRLGNLDDLLALSRQMRVDLVIVALPVAGENRLIKVVGKVSVLPADIKLPALASHIRLSPRLYSHVGSVAMIDLYDKPIADWGTVSKWLFDKTIGLAAVILLAPVMALIALAIKLESRGPVLFRQKRYGFNNELIEVLKFRSMYVESCDANAELLVTRADPRVTRVGRFIRKTSLDELPQFFNVLKGDLSLVGPRPHALAAKAADRLYNDVVAGYFARHKVKPGITGWAQVNGWRGETDTPEKISKRVEHDLYYIEHWSVFFDLYILLKTPGALFKSSNAY